MKIDSNYNYLPISYKTNVTPNFKRNWAEHISWGANYIKKTGTTNFKMFTFPNAKQVFVEVAEKAGSNFGAIRDRIVQILAIQGAAFTIKDLIPKDSESEIYKMESKGDGIYSLDGVKTEENAQYRYIIVKDNNEIELVKDPYSKKQSDINGWSEIYNPNNYKWENVDWLDGKDSRRIFSKKEEPLRGLENLIIEEVNVPTLSDEGTFEEAKKHIEKIAKKRIATAVEIMPVENTYSLQWGYDGVDKFAVNEKMGGAVKLKELIDFAHGKGLNVIMDMVPNHMGPDGDYLAKTGPYETGAGVFGGELNYEGENNRYVRDWITNAALWWVNEFKVDGLRLDMTKFCKSDYLLKQIVDEVNYHNPGIFIIAEDGRDNKHTVTTYSPYAISHEDDLELIDQSVENIAKKRWHTYPNEIGFDSEWDFPFMHELKDSIINTDQINLDRLSSVIRNSNYRVKYVMSHDEIGNLDGTRLIPKIIVKEMNLFNCVSGENDAEKGQKAAYLGQKLAELCIRGIQNISGDELYEYAKKYGLAPYSSIKKEELENVFNIAIAKHKLAIATTLTLPGPKMYFQGDDELDVSYFKFFREFSGEKIDREKNPMFLERILKEKGYDTLETFVRKECIACKTGAQNNFYRLKMTSFTSDLAKLVKSSKALTKGDIVDIYSDANNKVHIHHLKCDDEEVLVIKNFGNNFFFGNYGYVNFPQGNWSEIFNSDMSKYNGCNLINSCRDNICKDNQAINLAPNSICILKRVG